VAARSRDGRQSSTGDTFGPRATTSLAEGEIAVVLVVPSVQLLQIFPAGPLTTELQVLMGVVAGFRAFAQHRRARADVSMVAFDSRMPIGGAEAVSRLLNFDLRAVYPSASGMFMHAPVGRTPSFATLVS
jgi:hypothetical protein